MVFFNPGRNVDQVSRLRMVNAGGAPATVTITATDDSGASPAALGTSVPARGVRTFSPQDLEAGAADLDGAPRSGRRQVAAAGRIGRADHRDEHPRKPHGPPDEPVDDDARRTVGHDRFAQQVMASQSPFFSAASEKARSAMTLVME